MPELQRNLFSEGEQRDAIMKNYENPLIMKDSTVVMSAYLKVHNL